MLKTFKALASKHKEPKKKGCNLYILPDNSVVLLGFSYENHSPGFVDSSDIVRISEELIPVLLGSLVLTVINATKLVDHSRMGKSFRFIFQDLFKLCWL